MHNAGNNNQGGYRSPPASGKNELKRSSHMKNMPNKFLLFLKNNLTLVIVVAALVIFVIILGFIDNWSWKEYVSGIFTECIGIIITVIFVDMMFNRSQENTQRESEKNKILRICRLIELYLLRYIIYFNQLTNHPGDIFDCEIAALGNSPGSICHISGNCEKIMNKNQDMFNKTDVLINYIHFSCLYEDSRLFISGGFRSNIDCFYYIERKLQNAFMRLLTEIDFIYYKEIENIAMEFLSISISNDISDFIEHNKRIVYQQNSKEKNLRSKLIQKYWCQKVLMKYKILKIIIII
jgi:hypothetical protein